MPLDFPHNYTGNNIVSSISHQNLDKILTAINTGQKLSPQDVVTKEALDCLKFIKANRNGCGHGCKKYTAVAAYWTAFTALPFAALAATGKYAYDNFPAPPTSVEALKLYPYEHPYVSTIYAGGVSLGVLEAAAQKLGFSLIKPMTHGVATGYALLVNTLTKGVIRSYDADTAKKEEINKGLHKDIITNLQNTYNGIADDLHMRFSEVRNYPKQLQDFKNETNKLLTANSQFVQGLNKLKLNTAEIQQILSKFKSTIEVVLNEKIALRSGSSEQDMAYNANLLTHFPITAEHCIPAKAQQHIAAAKAHELGLAHAAKHCAATTVSGALAFVAVPVIAFASTFMCKEIPMPNNAYLCPTTLITSQVGDAIVTTCAPITTLSSTGFCANNGGALDSLNSSLKNSWDNSTIDASTIGVAVAGLAISSLIAARVSKGYQKESTDAKHTVRELNKLGLAEIVNVYNNLGSYYIKQLNNVKSDPIKLKALKDETEILVAKLEDIFHEIKNCGIDGLAPETLTNELQFALSEILITDSMPSSPPPYSR